MLHINKPIPKFSPMAIDIETSGLDPYCDRMLSVAVSNGEDTWILLDFYGFDEVKQHLEDETIVKIAHNAKYEYEWFLHHLGVRMFPIFDTQLAEDAIYKGYKWDDYPRSLEWTVNRRTGEILNKEVREQFFDHPGFSKRPVTSEQLDYMRGDVIYLPEIRNQQIEEGKKLGLLPTFDLENACVPITAELEYYGVSVDVDLWYQQVDQMQAIVDKHDKLAREVIGYDWIPVEYKSGIKYLSASSINFSSHQQMWALYIDVFRDDITHPKNKKPSTDAKWVLEPKLEDGSFTKRGEKFTRELLTMRMWTNRINKNYPKHINPVSGKIHGEYRQDGTDTGRYSCAKPNLQNPPRPTAADEPNIRNIFVADSEDYVIGRIDWSQQEPRILGQILGLPDTIKACNEEDVYIGVGKMIYKKDLTKKDPERHECKTALLAKNYGESVNTFCKRHDLTWEEGNRIYDSLEQVFPVGSYANKMRKQAQQYGFVTTLNGRRRNFDYTKSVPYNEPLNTPVQGTGADMLKIALVKVYNALTELKKCGKIDSNTRIWNIVHDEIDVQCHKDEVDIVLPLVKQLMEEAGREICPDVKHVAEAEYGYRWDK